MAVKMISDYEDPVERFFAYARERHAISTKRAAGLSRPWTQEPILQTYRFTSVFRELDKTTKWFRERVRDPLRDRPEVLLATVLFRMLNRIEVGEAIFCQQTLNGGTAWDCYLRTGDVAEIRRAVVAFCGKGPYVTGAYIISTPPGHNKLEGVLKVVDVFAKSDWGFRAIEWKKNSESLQNAFNHLKEFSYFGPFHSYEVVTDLRFTALLEKAPDIMTWANVGPGCRRGLNRLANVRREGKARTGWGTKIKESEALARMSELLAMSKDKKYWPQGIKAGIARNILDWPAWEMREVEHTLCEFDKMERTRTGEGTPRGRFR